MAEQLKIQVTADVRDALNGVKQVGQATQNMAKQAQQSAKILQGDFTKGTNQASASVLNLSRVVQDAPYAFTTGFGSIANNIDPLVDSFRRLKVETGSTSAAFGALGKSLLGGAGIGLAISLATSLITSFSLGLFGASKNAKAVEDALDGLAKNAAKDLTQLTSLVGVVKNLNSSFEDRQKAIAAINDQYKGYLSNLENERVSLNNIDAAYRSIAQNILNQAVLKGIQEEISLAVEETAKKLIQLEKEEAKRAKRNQDIADARTANIKLTDEEIAQLERLKTAQGNYTDEQIALLNKATKQQEQYNRAQSDGFGAAVKQQSVLQGQIQAFGSYEESVKRAKEELFKLLEPLLQLTAKFDDLGIKIPDLKLPKIDKAEIVITNGLFRFEKAEYAFPQPKDEDLKPLAKGLEGRVKVNPIDLDTKKFAKDIQTQARLIQQTLQPAFETLFSSILKGENAFKAFFQALGSSITQLISKLLAAAATAAILSAIFPGGVGGAKGFGGIFKLLVGGGTGLAEGGIVPPGFPNDSFPARLTSNEAVIPLNRIDSVLGGGLGNNVVVTGRLRGRDMILQNSRTQRSQRRTVGRAA